MSAADISPQGSTDVEELIYSIECAKDEYVLGNLEKHIGNSAAARNAYDARMAWFLEADLELNGAYSVDEPDEDETTSNPVTPVAAPVPTKMTTTMTEVNMDSSFDFIPGQLPLANVRGITPATFKHWSYMFGFDKFRNPVHLAQHLKDGQLVGQHVRQKDGRTSFLGSTAKLQMYGQWLWPAGGKKVVVTSSELGALSVSQAQGHKWPVVALPTDQQGGLAAFRRNFEWLNSFEEVILAFESDEREQALAQQFAGLFRPGKVRLAKLTDSLTDMLQAGRTEEIKSALWQAEVWRPGGIIEGSDITIEWLESDEGVVGYELPYPRLNDALRGLRAKELTFLVAGSGIGKSTIAREIGAHLVMRHGLKVANVFLEEGPTKSANAYMAIDCNVPLGELRLNPKILTRDQKLASMAKWAPLTMFFNHFGSLDSADLLAKLEYFAAAGCKFLILDHISIVVSGMASSKEGERKDIDILVTALRSLIERTGMGIICISHLTKADGTPHEEGGRINLDDLRGSGSLKQLADNVIALERNSQDEEAPNEADIRLLKNREWGDQGLMDRISYNKETGRLLPCPRKPKEAKEKDGSPFAAQDKLLRSKAGATSKKKPDPTDLRMQQYAAGQQQLPVDPDADIPF
ncbi:DnaB-like helicase C-terminal domain-containing protein [Rhizobacter sp. Root404]|uniref:DnaB-like helicase C-terminal domain-containing protein n=1 Tax=Rhizobacter sp. Root404 TaxID=1736528 RepID=UPI0007020737|nr:DnaB-like helicase C-terminal domain-containing protein [Rhizobacter sp. Root404]KQW36738.1 hypothetical protein ASC76_19065 [Rhizobacter sp. Root404]